jgi:hypothetical protein
VQAQWSAFTFSFGLGFLGGWVGVAWGVPADTTVYRPSLFLKPNKQLALKFSARPVRAHIFKMPLLLLWFDERANYEQRQDSQITVPPSERRGWPGTRHKALRALEASQSLNYLWRPPLGARAPKTEFLRLNQRKHTTHTLQRTTGTTPTSVTHWEFTGGVWEVACSSGALGEAGMGPGHRQNGGQRCEIHIFLRHTHYSNSQM